MRRVTGIFGGDPKPPAGGNPDSNTLISDMTTVICLDDYHSLDREGRKVAKVRPVVVLYVTAVTAVTRTTPHKINEITHHR
jgi:uncharacterized protein YdeI (YjbR/CyaY-like superfamily)